MLILDISTASNGLTSLGQPSAPPMVTTWLPPVLMVVGVTLLGILLVLAVKSRKRSAAHHHEGAAGISAAEIDRLNAARQQIQDVHSMAGELLNTAQRVSATLDQKTRAIQELLTLADSRINELSALLERDADTNSQSPGTRTATIETKPVRSADPLATAVYRLSDAGRKPVEIARELQEQVGKVELILALRET
jgi:hypothetical protein